MAFFPFITYKVLLLISFSTTGYLSVSAFSIPKEIWIPTESSRYSHVITRRPRFATITNASPSPLSNEGDKQKNRHDQNSFLHPLLSDLDDLYNRSSTIRCPFWRRRAADFIDNAAMMMRFLAVRHKSLGLPFFEAPGCKAVGRHVKRNPDGTICKLRNLDLEVIADIIRSDWCSNTSDRSTGFVSNSAVDGIGLQEEISGDHKGYYITGKLDSTIYRDDCLFDGPDPDMPVRGLRKYLAAASHLFDPKYSSAQLISLQIMDKSVDAGKFGRGVIVAKWKLGGVLMLPWRPAVKPWTGKTRYHLDEEGLVAFHEESWDISVMEAFVTTVFPNLGDMIWGRAVLRTN